MKKSTPRILWDFRLFSTGYAQRGVGIYCRSLCEQILQSLSPSLLFIWGNKEHAPDFLHNYPVNWIPYKQHGWKFDLFIIPFLIVKYRIDIFHYWILFGPLVQCGIGLFHPCTSIATVHDLGVAYWDVPYLNLIRKSMYWRVQKLLSKSIRFVYTNSQATKSDCITYFSRSTLTTYHTYMPLKQICTYVYKKRKPYFIALGGSPHKNAIGVSSAFKEFRRKSPNFTLLFLGAMDIKEIQQCTGENIDFEPSMNLYSFHLRNSTALIFCSFTEGLGIPPLEAMQLGCPLIVSDIPSLNETCSNAAIFVNPIKTTEIQSAMIEVSANTKLWSQKAYAGAKRYTDKSKSNIEESIKHYNNLLSYQHR